MPGPVLRTRGGVEMSTDAQAGWQARVDAVWARADELGDAEVVRRIDDLAAERPSGDPLALFERAGARDSAGLEVEAEPLYSRGDRERARRRRARAGAHPARLDDPQPRAAARVDRAARRDRSPRRASCATPSWPSAPSRSSTRATPGARHPMPSRPLPRTCRGTADRSRRTPRALGGIRLGRTAPFACVAPDRFE